MCTVCCIVSPSMRFPICQVLNVPIYPSAEGATQHADCMIDHATEANRLKNSTFHRENILSKKFIRYWNNFFVCKKSVDRDLKFAWIHQVYLMHLFVAGPWRTDLFTSKLQRCNEWTNDRGRRSDTLQRGYHLQEFHASIVQDGLFWLACKSVIVAAAIAANSHFEYSWTLVFSIVAGICFHSTSSLTMSFSHISEGRQCSCGDLALLVGISHAPGSQKPC